MPQSLIVISFATVSFVIIMIQLITYAELVSGNPSVLDVSIDDTLTIKWTAQCSGRNHEEVTNIIYGCTQGGIPIKDSDLMTIQSRNDAHGPAKKYLEKELPIPANMSLTTGGNWTCVFKLKGEQNRDCLTEDSVCVLVDAQSFSGISGTLTLNLCVWLSLVGVAVSFIVMYKKSESAIYNCVHRHCIYTIILSTKLQVSNS